MDEINELLVMLYYGSFCLVAIGVIISLVASLSVNITFSHYAKVRNRNGFTSNQVVAMMLSEAGIRDVKIERVRGSLTDHYAPSTKTLRLSESVFGSTSVAAIGVAAHECGHAIQHHRKFLPLVLRNVAVPVANIGSKLSWPVIILGLILGFKGLAEIGILLFVGVIVVQIITLPVEFDASFRALKILKKRNILVGDENAKARRVLFAAASTYVAAVITSILQLLRLIAIVGGGRGRRRR